MSSPLSARKSTFDCIFQEPLLVRQDVEKPVKSEKKTSRTQSAASRATVLVTENPRFIAERNKRIYNDWQKIKEEAKEEDREYLEAKIALQHELIHAQDELAALRRKEENENKTKKLEAERAVRKAKVDAVLETSRKSIERRRTALTGHLRAAGHNNGIVFHGTKDSDSKVTDDVSHSVSDTDATQTESGVFHGRYTNQHGRDDKESITDAPQNSVNKKFVVGTVRYSDVLNTSENVGEVKGSDEGAEVSASRELPLYQVQLYDLYGQEADNFLNPKFREKTPARPLQETDFMDANVLWTNLRKESSKKIQDVERRLPNDLKATFDSYIREFVSDKENSRDFYTTKDVPDIAYLMDESRLMKTYAYHHKTQLMFRSSHKNEDSTKVLLFNNPIPDINNQNGEEGVERFLPTRESEDRFDETTQELPSFVTLSIQLPTPMIKQEVSKRPISNVRVFDLTEIEQKKNETGGAALQCVFLTSDMSETPGSFSKKKKELLIAQQQDDMYTHRRDVGKKPATVDGATVSSTSQKGVSRLSKLRSRPARKLPVWEPLTLAALLEYSNKVPAPGRGAFSAGDPRSWVVTN